MSSQQNSSDILQRFIFEEAPVRGEYIHLDKAFQEIIQQHAYPPSLKKLLGEVLCVAGLLRAVLKFDGHLTVQFSGEGKLKLLIAQCDHTFQLRALAKWEGKSLTEKQLMQALQEGTLAIMLDSDTGNRYQGIVAWQGNSLAESLENYFKHSEQLATRIWLAVDDKSAAGFLLQIIPGKDSQEETAQLEDWQRITERMQHLTAKDLLSARYPDILNEFYAEEDVRIFPAQDVIFKCRCSQKRGEEAILILGKEEALAELDDKQTLVVTCDFCNREYVFDRDAVMSIFTQTKH